MRLLRLEVTNFGKLRRPAPIELHPGLNLFLGDNETGKSTLQQAILAALFGFYGHLPKGSPPRGEAAVEEQYRPWDAASPYACAIEYELGDGRYRLHRAFDAAATEVTLHDLSRGEDLSEGIDYGRYKTMSDQDQAAYLGTSRAAFLGSAAIGQGQLAQLAEPAALDAAFALSLDSESGGRTADKAIEALRGEATALGVQTARSDNSKRELSLALRQLEIAEGRLRHWQERHDRVEAAIDESRRLEERLEAAQRRLERLAAARTALEARSLEERIERTRQARARLEGVTAERQEYARFAAFPIERWDEVLRTDEAVSRATRELEAEEAAWEEGAGGRRDDERELAGLEAEIEERADLRRFPRERKGQLHNLHVRWAELDARARAEVAAGPAQPRPGWSLPPLLGATVAALVITVGGAVAGYLLPALALALVCIAVGALLARPRPAAPAEAPEPPQPSAIVKLRGVEMAMRGILDEAGISVNDFSPAVAVALFDEKAEEADRLAEDERRAEAVRERLEQHRRQEERLARLRQERQAGIEAHAALMAAAGIDESDPERARAAFAEQRAGKRRYDELWNDEARARLEVDVASGGRSEEELSAALAAVRRRLEEMRAAPAEPREGEPIPQEEAALGAAVEATRRDVAEMREHRSRLDERIANAFAGIDYSRAEAEEEVAGAQQEVARWTHYRRALSLAADKLGEATRAARADFVPQLQAKLSESMRHITDGRYERAMVSFVEGRPVELSLLDPTTGDPRRAEWLSLGTREQCYICLRLAIAQLLSAGGKKLPLILDDPFVNFDRPRLERMLRFLAAVAQEHQVLLFTKDTAIAEWFRGNGAAKLHLMQELHRQEAAP